MQSFIFAAALMSAAVSGLVTPRNDDPECQSDGNTCGSTQSITYTVKQGDTLTKIAEDNNSGICDIAKVNNIENINSINAGITLTIPKDCTNPDNESCLTASGDPTETCVLGLPGSYTIVSGDTLSNISKDFNITLDALTGANTQISNPDAIKAGDILSIPVCQNSQCATVGTYTIASGDVYVDLAAKFGSTVGQIKALNNNINPTELQIGQTIVLPQNCANVTVA